MSNRGSATWAFALAIASSIGFAATMPAQDTTRTRIDSTTVTKTTGTTRTTRTKVTSQKRIPVSKKEVGGEVSLPAQTQANQDSLARLEQMRRDSIARMDSIAMVERARQDSLNAIAKARQDSIDAANKAREDSIEAVAKARQDSIARADSINQANALRRSHMKLNGGWYLGLATGPSSPMGDFHNLGYGTGWNVTVPIGYQSNNQVLGIRLDLAYNSFNSAADQTFTSGTGTAGTTITFTNPSPKVYSAVLNGTLRFPFGAENRNGFYLLAGGGLYMFRNFGNGSLLAGYLGNSVIEPEDTGVSKNINKWGVNGGAGVDFGIGRSSLFLESRFENVFAGSSDPNFDTLFGNHGNNLRFVPVVLGIRFH